MSTTRLKKSRRTKKEPSSPPSESSTSKIPHDEPITFRSMMSTLINPDQGWPSYNIDKPEDRDALLERVFTTMKASLEDVQGKVKEWTERWILPSLEALSDDQKRRLITEMEGVCLQEDWDILQSELSVSSREQFGRAVAQTMIYKIIFTTFYQNPFWFCDGKMYSEIDDVDPSFTQAMAHLYDRFFVDNPEVAILWRMQLCRLMFNKPGSKHHSAATWSLFEYDENRLAPCRALAEQLMESEPFQWLLADAPFVFNQEWRMISLSRVIDFAAGVIAQVEAAYGGHTVFYRLSELEAAYSQDKCDVMGHMKLHEFNGGPDDEANLEGRRLVLIVRPAIATMLSPLRKWLGHDNKTVEFIGPAMVLTGREVPASERNIEKKDEDAEVGESNVSGSKAEG